MTKGEIKALISSAIAGQGTNVDGGGQLPTILNAIVDALPSVFIFSMNSDNEASASDYDKAKEVILAGGVAIVNSVREDGAIVTSTCWLSIDGVGNTSMEMLNYDDGEQQPVHRLNS